MCLLNNIDTGAAQLCNANPEMNCFSTDPRAQLFRAHQENVSSLEMFMELMTSNNYETDPLSLGDPCNVCPTLPVTSVDMLANC